MNKVGLIWIALFLAFGFQSCKVQKTFSTYESLPVFTWNPEGNTANREIEFYESLFDGIKEELINYNFSNAIKNYEKCLRINPEDPSILYKLGEVYFKAGRQSDAVNVLRKAFSLDPKNYWIGHALADIYVQLNDFKNATLVIEKMTRFFPDNIELKKELSEMYFATKNFSKSIKILNEIEYLIGINEETSERKKQIYIFLRKEKKAVRELEKLLAAYPDNTDYIHKLIDLYIDLGKKDKVFELYKKITEIDPDDPTAQLIVADYYLRWNMKNEGLEIAEKALANPYLDLQSKITFLMLNFLNKKEIGSDKEVLLKFSNLLVKTHAGDSRVYSFRGDVKSALGMEDEALTDYRKALEGEKNIAVLWNTVIVGLMKKGNYSEALDYCKQATEYFPLNPEIYLYSGMCYLRLKNFEEAARQLETGLIYVKNNDVLFYQFYANLGEAYNGIKDYEKSDKYFEKALSIDDNDLSLLNNYAYYLSLRKEKLEKAAQMSLKTLEKEPENPAYLDTYGWILFLQHDFQNAKKYLDKALINKGWDAEILEHYGDLLFKLGDTENAMIYWKRAREKGAQSPLLERKITDKQYYE